MPNVFHMHNQILSSQLSSMYSYIHKAPWVIPLPLLFWHSWYMCIAVVIAIFVTL